MRFEGWGFRVFSLTVYKEVEIRGAGTSLVGGRGNVTTSVENCEVGQLECSAGDHHVGGVGEGHSILAPHHIGKREARIGEADREGDGGTLGYCLRGVTHSCQDWRDWGPLKVKDECSSI